MIKTAYHNVFKRSNIESMFESTGIYNLNPLTIPANTFPPATAFDRLDAEVNPPEIELHGYTNQVGRA